MRTEDTWYSLTLTYHMPQTERLQIITGTSAPQSTDHLGRFGQVIAEAPFPSPNYNHSSTPYAHLEDFSGETDYRHYLRGICFSIIRDDSIDIPNHFTRFFSYVEFYRKVFLGEISATKPLIPTPTPTVDMSKGHGCDHKWQAKEDWIRAVALLRLWGCDNGVSNVGLLVRQQGVLGGSEGAEQYVNYSNYGSLIDNRNNR